MEGHDWGHEQADFVLDDVTSTEYTDPDINMINLSFLTSSSSTPRLH